MNYVTKASSIFTIGLRSKYKDAGGSSRFWSVADIKKLLQEFLNVARRPLYNRVYDCCSYQSYLCVSWKPVENVMSFTSFVSTVSKFSDNGFTNNESFPNEETNRTTIQCRYQRSSMEEYSDIHCTTNNSLEPKSNDEKSIDHYQNRQIVETETCNVKSKDETRATSPTTFTVMAVESNDQYTSHNSNAPSICKAKRSVCVQTSGRSKSRRKKSRKDPQNRGKKDVALDPREKSCSKNIKTIFVAEGGYFNCESSKSNLELQCPRNSTFSQRDKKLMKKSREIKLSKSSKRNDRFEARAKGKENIQKQGDAELNGPGKENIKKENAKVQTFSETNRMENSKNHNLTTVHPKRRNEVGNESQIILNDGIFQNKNKSTVSGNENLNELMNESRAILDDRIFKNKNKLRVRVNEDLNEVTNESRILKNVNKSAQSNHNQITNQNNGTQNPPGDLNNSEEIFFLESSTINRSTTLWESRSYKMEEKISEMMILGNVKKRLEEDYDDYFSVNEFDSENDPRVDVEDGNKEQPFWDAKTSRREQEYTQSSSMEYCSIASLSLSRFHSTQDNSVEVRFCEDETSTTRRCSSNEASFDDDVFQDSQEFLDESLTSSHTMRCYQRNSTRNLPNSPKLVTESLDSGILADYARDPRASTERLQTKSKSSDTGKSADRPNSADQKRRVREWDLLPTYDFNSDSSYSDESLNRRVDVAVKRFTENLILAERRAKMKLCRLERPARHRQSRRNRKRVRQRCSPACKLESSHCWFNNDDKIISSSSPPLFSFSDSEIDHV